MPRCCTPIPDEFRPTYASVLASRDLQAEITALETGPLLPCFTAWCSNCKAPYLITSAVSLFKSPSEHHAHMLVLARNVAAQTTSTSDPATAAAKSAVR
jgi:hypothetical protein